MNINEQFELDKGRKTSRLFLNVLDNLQISISMGTFVKCKNRNTDFTINVARCQSLGFQVLKHDIHFNSISPKTFVDIRRLNHISKTGHPMRLLGHN